MTIEETIIKPLQNYIDGTEQLFRFPMTLAARGYVDRGYGCELHRLMCPYYVMYFDDSARLDWTSRNTISEIASIDPLFKGIPNFRQTRIQMLRAETTDELIGILEDCRAMLNHSLDSTP